MFQQIHKSHYRSVSSSLLHNLSSWCNVRYNRYTTNFWIAKF